ncbi:MAG TPA: putative lipid II flippase FtsW [Terriglobia bacterium]|nr:putative lipid II flippase FtsW [Terriglobia bacterium]
MPKKLRPDRTLFLITLVLVALGVAMVFSSSVTVAKERYNDPYMFAFKQLLASVIGLATMLVAMKVDYHYYRSPLVVFSGLSIVISLLVLVFFLPPSANVQRWIPLPGFSFQPSEMAKLALVLFFAYLLEKRQDTVNEVGTLIPALAMAGLIAGLILLEPDLGTAVSMMLVMASLLFVAGLALRWFLGAILLAAPAFYFFVLRVPWRRARILVFLDPHADPQGIGFQPWQSLISVGTGGISGLGFMEGKQKLFYLPAAHTDFIYAVIGEELGLIGAVAVLGLFAAFVWRGVRASRSAPDSFGFYLALGITLTIGLQAFINMSVVLSLLPTKGIPLPFLSYGGSSFIVMLAAVGILLNVSQQSRAGVT